MKPTIDHVDSIIAQDLKIFNFEVEEKLDQLSRLEFDGEFDSNSLKALKLYFDRLIGCNWLLIGQKNENFQFWATIKLITAFWREIRRQIGL